MQTIRRLEEEVDMGKVTLLESVAAGYYIPYQAQDCDVVVCGAGLVLRRRFGYLGGFEQRRSRWCLSPICQRSFWVRKAFIILTCCLLCGFDLSSWEPSSLIKACPSCSVLLWRRSDNVCFALILGGRQNVSAGDRVECRLKGILQVLHMHTLQTDELVPAHEQVVEQVKYTQGAFICAGCG